MNIFFFILIAVVSYLLGSLSFSIIFTKLFMKEDIRRYGSGNAGMTNVLRTAGKLPAILTFAGDFAKAALSVLFVHLLIGQGQPILVELGCYLAGFFCLMGHVFPCYYGFKGGKGVLVSATMILFIDWRICLVVVAVFAIATMITRWVSLGSVLASVTFPIATWFMYRELTPTAADLSGPYHFVYTNQRFIVTAIAFVFGLIVIIKHKDNIIRLLHGQERKISFHKNKEA